MPSPYASTIQRILSLGRGPKVLLLDDTTSVMISNLIPHSTFLDHDFFLFEYITSKQRTRISETTCICFIRLDSLALLLSELQSPFYSDYILLFSNTIPDSFLGEIAEADVSCSVRGLYEVYIDLIQQQSNLFTVYAGSEKVAYGSTDFTYVKRVCDGLYSIYRTLNCVPCIRVQCDSEMAKFIGVEMSARFTGCDKSDGTLLVLDRKMDIISCLVYAWTFQAMISEYIGLDNGVVKIGSKSYAIDSEIFDSVKFMDINTASSEIRKYSKEKTHKVSSGIIKNLTDNSKRSEIAESLLTIYNRIMQECIGNKELSELEYHIIVNKRIEPARLSVLKDRSIPYVKRLKVLIIYLLRKKFNFKALEHGSSEVSDVAIQYAEFREDLLRFRDMYLTDSATCTSFKFRSDVDVKLGYEPFIKSVVAAFLKDRINPVKYPMVRNGSGGKGNLVIYVVGGLTYNEYKIVSEINKERELQIYIVTDRMITYNSMIEECRKK